MTEQQDQVVVKMGMEAEGQIVSQHREEFGIIETLAPAPVAERPTLALDELQRLLEQESGAWSAPSLRIGNEIEMLQSAEPHLVEKAASGGLEVGRLAEDLDVQALRRELGLDLHAYAKSREQHEQVGHRHLRATRALRALRIRLDSILPKALASVMTQDTVSAHRKAGEDVTEFRQTFLDTFGTDQQEFGTPSAASKAWLEVTGRQERLASLRGKLLGETRPPQPVAQRLIRAEDVDRLRREGKAPETIETLNMWTQRM